jgi:hypothetical protein
MRRLIRVILAPFLVLGVAGLAAFLPADSLTAQSPGPSNQILKRELDIELGRVQRTKRQMPVSSGAVYAVLAASGELERRAAAVPTITPSSAAFTQGCQNTIISGTFRGLTNSRVNQDCSLRRQAEEVIAINPTNTNNLIAGYNDSRIGFNHCGYAWSFDGGQTWGDQVPPFWGFTLADGHTADACSDPTVTFDASGNAYIAGILFDITSVASALVVAKSNTGIGGAFFHSPDSTLTFQTYRTAPLGVVASDNDPCIFHDKEFIVADTGAASPKKNRVYVTWTRFTCNNSPIYFSQSTDGGRTWSAGIPISGNNPAICTAFSVVPGACDQDQGSHPIVGPDGTIYVVFGNGNTPLFGINQVLFVKCPAAADCTNPTNWTAPVKVNDLIGTHPIAFAPNAAGCPVGRQCLPPNGYRVPEFTSISIAVDNSNRLYVTWSDFRNGVAPCNTLDFATSSPPCDNDVFYAYSTTGGMTWSAATKITPAGSAQWQPWSGVVANGSVLWVAYYDRSYGNCEFTGCNDITLARIGNPATPMPAISYTRLTTASMPNLVVANNPLQAGFLGDYMWVTVHPTSGRAYVVWADTRGLGGTVEEDIYFAAWPFP